MERLVYFRPIKKKKGTARKRGSRCIKRQTFEFLATSPPSRVTCSAVEGGGGGGDFISLESSQQIVNSLGNIICSSNGLLLCGIHPRTYYIFNPVTKESYQLPPPPGKNWEPSTSYIMGLVAANCADVSTTSSIRYKVVHADTRSRDAVSGNKVKIGTFSSETGKWRQSMVPLTGTGNYYCLDSLRKTTVIRGAIHWVAFHIGVYDPYKVDGHMEMIATPPFQFIHECVMGESTDNLLQIAVFTDTLTSIQVWVYHSNEGQWSLRHELPIGLLHRQIMLLDFHPHIPEAVFFNFHGYIYLQYFNIPPRSVKVHYRGCAFEGISPQPYFLPRWPTLLIQKLERCTD
ncbi:F-box protein At5g03970-like [Macadamia integrifolia]|uniref:F-box protein At5g03970-like n=1 Tax=Macadamia integrifolia TaxID=60698 RepID=UPI001C4F3DDD|nr:F-box protein At5g03970-like [Macadamia integrifolia]